MGKLVFDVIRTHTQYVIQNSPRHRSEAAAARFIFLNAMRRIAVRMELSLMGRSPLGFLALGQCAVGGFQRAPLFDASNHFQ